MKDILKKTGQFVARLFIRYLIRMFLALVGSATPVLLIIFLLFLTLDSMFNHTGELLNFTGRDNFDSAMSETLKQEYMEKADEWKVGLTEEEISQVEQNNHNLSWGVLAAVDKLAYNFDDLSKRGQYRNETYDIIKPEFRFITLLDQRYIEYAHTYIGEYQYHYKVVCDKNDKCSVVLESVDTKITYQKLKNALKHYKLETEQNVDIVIFQAYGFDRNLKDPKVKTLFPPEMTKMVARSSIGLAPRNEQGEIDLYAVLPDKKPTDALQSLKVKVQVYDETWRINKGRTSAGTLPRRGSNHRFGTIAVAKNNPYGLKQGMKIYVPKYGYGIVEEYNDNIDDSVLEDDLKTKISKFLFFSYDVIQNFIDEVTNRTKKEEVVYLYMGEPGNTDADKLLKAQIKISTPITHYYEQVPIYLYPPNYEIPMPKLEEAGKSFFDGSTWPITSPFGYRIHPILHTKKFHDGVDFGVPSGIPILAINSGAVTFAGNAGSAGNMVDIKLDTKVTDGGREKDVTVRYMHLSKIAAKPGRIRQGEVIGYVGSTGRSTGPHVHLTTIIGGEKRDPLKYIPLIKYDGTLDLWTEQPDFEGGVIANPANEKWHYVDVFKITAYTAGYESTGKRPGHPDYGKTASGAMVKLNHTIAADWKVLPKGTVVRIEGLNYQYVVEDKGGGVNGKHIDLYVATESEAKEWGVKRRKVWVWSD